MLGCHEPGVVTFDSRWWLQGEKVLETATSIIGIVMIATGFVMLVVAVVGIVRWKLQQAEPDAQQDRRNASNA